MLIFSGKIPHLRQPQPSNPVSAHPTRLPRRDRAHVGCCDSHGLLLPCLSSTSAKSVLDSGLSYQPSPSLSFQSLLTLVLDIVICPPHLPPHLHFSLPLHFPATPSNQSQRIQLPGPLNPCPADAWRGHLWLGCAEPEDQRAIYRIDGAL
jgi:hypothetical protein